MWGTAKATPVLNNLNSLCLSRLGKNQEPVKDQRNQGKEVIVRVKHTEDVKEVKREISFRFGKKLSFKGLQENNFSEIGEDKKFTLVRR